MGSTIVICFRWSFFTIHVFDLMKTMHWLKTNYQVDGSNVWNFNVWKHNWFEHIKRVESSELLHKWVMSCCVLTRCGIKWTVHLFSAPYPTVEIPRCHHQPWHGPFSFAKTNGWNFIGSLIAKVTKLDDWTPIRWWLYHNICWSDQLD
jgi:hypothetical protein